MAGNPEISQITLPNGHTYDLKDTVARLLITNNGTFIIAWNGTGTPVAGNIPDVLTINSVTGALHPTADTLKNFYLVKSSTEIENDIYDEYVTVITGGTSTTPTYGWEKIGDTLILLSAVVTGVTLNALTANVVTGYANPSTASVIGKDATFTVTLPTIIVTPSTTYIKAAATNGAVSVSANAQVNAITAFNNTTTATAVTGITTTKDKNLVTTKITGVSGSVTASLVSTTNSLTTVSGFTSNNTTSAFFKGWTVNGENLTINGVLPSTQTTTQIQIDLATVTVPKAATSSTTVATGQVDTEGDGDTVVTDVTASGTASVLTGLGTPTTAAALGTTATFKVTNPTISLSTDNSSGTGKVLVATGISSASASGGNVAWADQKNKTVITGLGTPSTATVLTNSTTITVTKGNTP